PVPTSHPVNGSSSGSTDKDPQSKPTSQKGGSTRTRVRVNLPTVLDNGGTAAGTKAGGESISSNFGSLKPPQFGSATLATATTGGSSSKPLTSTSATTLEGHSHSGGFGTDSRSTATSSIFGAFSTPIFGDVSSLQKGSPFHTNTTSAPAASDQPFASATPWPFGKPDSNGLDPLSHINFTPGFPDTSEDSARSRCSSFTSTNANKPI
ncbi:hypothetical protein FQN49_003168, partial [Arthroderma sp. PD_2]